MEKYGKLDQKDTELLKELKEDAKQTTIQLSKKLRLPSTTVHNRIKRLEKKGVIKKYTVEIDNGKLGRPLIAYILVTVNYMLSSGIKISQEETAREIKRLEEVDSVDIMTGVSDMLVKVRITDVSQLNEFVVRKLRKIDGVDKTQTMIVLSEF